MDGPQNHSAKLKKSDTKEYLFYYQIYMKCLGRARRREKADELSELRLGVRTDCK